METALRSCPQISQDTRRLVSPAVGGQRRYLWQTGYQKAACKMLLMGPASVISALHPRCAGRGVESPGSPRAGRLVSRPGQLMASGAGEKVCNKVRSTTVYRVKSRAVQT